MHHPHLCIPLTMTQLQTVKIKDMVYETFSWQEAWNMSAHSCVNRTIKPQ